MAFNNGFTAVVGATYTAAQYNTYVRDNFTAIWAYTTAGDIVYAAGATTLTRLGIGANGSYLESNGSAPVWTKFYRPAAFLLNTDIALNTGDDAYRFRVPFVINGWNLYSVAMARKSGTGVLTVQLRNVGTGFDMLTTKLTVDSGETDTITAATAAVIDTARDDVATGNQLAIDADVAGTSTLYAQVEMVFAKP